MAPPQSTAPRGKGKGTIAATHDAATTIRHQQQAKKDVAGTSRDVVKAVLASPLTVAWPNIPRHLQTSTLHAVRELVPPTIADYHVSRARCHTKEKRSKRRKDKPSKGIVASSGSGDADQNAIKEVNNTMEDKDKEDTASSKRKTPPQTSIEPPHKKSRTTTTTHADVKSRDTVDTNTRPTRPEIMSHFVLGINEVIKSLEKQIDELKIRLSLMASALNDNGSKNPPSRSGLVSAPNHLLPTAPRSPSPDDDDDPSQHEDEAGSSSSSRPLAITFIIVPLLSINPQSLVSPIPSYCATYNALIYQYNQLANIVKTRTRVEDRGMILGSEGEREMAEVRVVPLGNVESDLAEMVGLRRLACLAIRKSHPNIDILHKLLPKSILHPPRHSLTLPYPLSTSTRQTSSSSSNSKKQPLTTHIPIPHVHYSPLHIKGVQTSIPIDGATRKAKRLEEVRRKRVETKERKKALREGIRKVPSKKGGKKKQKEKGSGDGNEKKDVERVTLTRNEPVAVAPVMA